MKKLFLFALLGLFEAGQAQNLLANLQACYPLDCDNAVNNASTGPSLNGTINSVTCTTGHTGVSSTAYQFAGSVGSYISLPGLSPIKPTNAITVSGWYKVGSTTASQYLVFTKNTCTSNFEAYYLALVSNGTNAQFKVGLSSSGCTPASFTSVNNVTLGGWYHVVFYIDNSTIQLYVNNVFEGSTSHGISLNYASGKDVILGGSNESFNLPFTGSMDNVRFYDRQLLLAEISDLYTFDPGCSSSGVSLLNGLEACYPLDCDAKNFAPTMSTPPSLDGTLNNVTCVTGHSGISNTAQHFSGSTSSYIDLPNDVRLKPNTFSWTGWINADATPTSNQYLLYTKNICTTNFEAYYLNMIQVGSLYYLSTGMSDGFCNYAQLTSITSIAPTKWYHVAIYIDNSVVKLYINGALDNSITHSNSFSYSTTRDIILGGTNESYNQPYKGSMDNLRFYSRELTATEVYDIYTKDPNCRAEMRPTGLSKLSANTKESEVYPNPNNGKMYLENPEAYTLMVQDLNGRQIDFVQTSVNEKTTEIKLNNPAQGFYFVKMINKEGKVMQVSKIVVTP